MGRLPVDETTQLCRRLSLKQNLVLPASLMQGRDTQPSQSEIDTYLSNLVRRDPSVFLERYGKELQQDELLLFDHLSDDYEVGFYLKNLRRGVGSSKQEIRVKNRRLAYMMKLLDEGEYFGDEKMRARDPLLFEQYIGSAAVPTSRPRKLSESILQNAEEEEIREKLAAAREREEMCEEEEESDDDFPAEAIKETTRPRSSDEVEFMRKEFETIMRERFLSGEDTDYIDYSTIDNDVLLDDDLLDIANRDEEDRHILQTRGVNVER